MQETLALPITILVGTVIAALIISLFISLRISSRITKRHEQMAGRIRQLEENAARQASETDNDSPTPIERLQLDAQQMTATCDMDDSQLLTWLDHKMDELLLYCQPDIDLKTASLATGLSQRRIQQVLREYEGITPPTFTEYVTTKRIQQACRLLTDQPNWSIDAVGREVGFTSIATFRRQFNRLLGMSPSEFRNRMRIAAK